MYFEKTRRSFRRFRRRLASLRRKELRQLQTETSADESLHERQIHREPTRQEKRVEEAFHQDLREVEIA